MWPILPIFACVDDAGEKSEWLFIIIIVWQQAKESSDEIITTHISFTIFVNTGMLEKIKRTC